MSKAFRFINTVKRFPAFELGPLNFELEPGCVMGYIGPNGSGKSTTMHCMAGLLKADSGKIEIFGRENNPDDIKWKFDIGYVGDKHVFYENWTAEKNLKFISQFYPDWSDSMAKDLIKRFDIPMNKKVMQISGGNRVKLSLIMALAHKPKLLLLDEPTAGLDPVIRSEFLDVLFEVVEHGERSVFYSTHILSDISRIADELAFLDNGKVKIIEEKENLTEKWRSISFKLTSNHVRFIKTINTKQEGSDFKIISSDHEATIKQLVELGAENIRENRMAIDEIAVWILKEKNIK